MGVTKNLVDYSYAIIQLFVVPIFKFNLYVTIIKHLG